METPVEVQFPGGERYAELRARALGAMATIRARHPGESAVLVAHAGPLRAMLAECLAMPDEAIFRLAQDLGAVSIVEWTDGAPAVRLLNGRPRSVAAALREPASPSATPRVRRSEQLTRPPLPPGFDESRAQARRRHAPRSGASDDAERAAVWRAIRERRDIRRFRPDPLAEGALERLLEAAHAAPSVGMMQPWRFIVVRSARRRKPRCRRSPRANASRRPTPSTSGPASTSISRSRGCARLPSASVSAATAAPEAPRCSAGTRFLRPTSTAPAWRSRTSWLVARAEGNRGGLGLLLPPRRPERAARPTRPRRSRRLSLCVGYPDERPLRPGLEAAGWRGRGPLAELVHLERWHEARSSRRGVSRARRRRGALSRRGRSGGGALRDDGTAPADLGGFGLDVRDASDELGSKPPGSLGALELLVERWAMATGAPPPGLPHAGILVCAGDHGVAARGVSLYPARVGAQVAAAAARGETAIGVLARALGAELLVADIGLKGPKLPGLHDRRVAAGSADMTRGPALSHAQLRAAVKAGHALAADLAARAATG